MTRREAPISPPVVLTIAGSDSGGGAGIQADLKTIEACGGFGTSAITSVTAQNTQGVDGSHRLPIEDIDAQIDAVREDFDVAAVKTGMLATSDVIDLVADHAATLPNLVVDPVMVAASGDRLLAEEAEAAYEELVAEATLVTPNADEAVVLTEVAVDDPESAERAGRVLVEEQGADAALVKGGHLTGDHVVDTLVAASAEGEDPTVTTFRHDRVETDATHGSGCTLSSAIATDLAHGDDLATAVGAGIDLLARAVRYNVDVGRGPGSVHHLVELRDDASRSATADLVHVLADRVREEKWDDLAPAGGIGLAAATPHAEEPADVAAVAGRLPEGAHARMDDTPSARDDISVRFGADYALASLLLAARENDPDVRFAGVVATEPAALEGIDAPTRSLDGPGEMPDPSAQVPEAVLEVIRTAESTPAAVSLASETARDDEGAPIAVFGTTTTALCERFDALAHR